MIATENEIRVAGVHDDSIVDGPGLRLSIFLQGCRRACVGCHNPESWPLDGGTVTSAAELLARIDRNPLLTGITFSGGEPLLRAGALKALAEGISERGLDLAVYTGYTFEELLDSGDPAVFSLLAHVSTLIDGAFVLAQKSLMLPFRGSENQRVLDVGKSLLLGQAVPTEDPQWGYLQKITQ